MLNVAKFSTLFTDCSLGLFLLLKNLFDTELIAQVNINGIKLLCNNLYLKYLLCRITRYRCFSTSSPTTWIKLMRYAKQDVFTYCLLLCFLLEGAPDSKF